MRADDCYFTQNVLRFMQNVKRYTTYILQWEFYLCTHCCKVARTLQRANGPSAHCCLRNNRPHVDAAWMKVWQSVATVERLFTEEFNMQAPTRKTPRVNPTENPPRH